MIFHRHRATKLKRDLTPISSAGFSLVELMVTLSIVILATGLVMIKYASFNSSVLLNSLAYQIAFDIREAQSLGISVRGSGGVFFEEYGMYFNFSEKNQYKLFQDNGDTKPARYNAGEEIGEPIIIDPRFTIVNICGIDMGDNRRCADGDGFPDEISISFARPDFNAVLYGESMSNPLKEVEIIVGPGNGGINTRTVLVTRGGMISVKN